MCHPDAMTPDGNPLLGPLPGVPGFWMAAGLSLNGFGGAGGMGRKLAEWMTQGETELDTDGYRAWRFGAAHRDPMNSAVYTALVKRKLRSRLFTPLFNPTRYSNWSGQRISTHLYIHCRDQ